MSLHPFVARALAPGAPLPLRLATARGTIPVSRPALVPALVQLVSDPDAAVRAAAGETMGQLTEVDIRTVLSDPETEGGVVDHFLTSPVLKGELLATALSHPSASDEALCELASRGTAETLEILASNQERLIRCPAILDLMEANPQLSGILRSRLADFRDQFFPAGLPSSPAPGLPTAVSEAPSDVVTEQELQELIREVGDLPFLSVDLGDLIESQGMSLDPEDLLATDADLESVWLRLSRMTGPQRLRVALRGGREERALLVRDRNRIISAAVLKNPRLTEMEVEGFASLRSLHEDILRFIGQSRTWMRSYPVVLKLTRNPKTPSGIAMNHLGRLVTRDLQNISRDHNVPEAIRRMARRQLEVREQKTDFSRGRH